MDMRIVIDRLVNGGVIVKSDNCYIMNDGNYSLTVFSNGDNLEVIEIYQKDDDFYGIVVNDAGYDKHIKLSYSSMMLVKVIDIMTL